VLDEIQRANSIRLYGKFAVAKAIENGTFDLDKVYHRVPTRKVAERGSFGERVFAKL
jgi:hypothetical protein